MMVATVLAGLPTDPAAGTPGPDRPVRLVLDSITPKAPGQKSTLQVRGHLVGVNAGLEQVSVRLRYSSQPFVSRGILDAYAAGRQVGPTTTVHYDSVVNLDLRPARHPDGSVSFTIRAPVSSLGLQRFGVYPLAVEVVGDGSSLATVRTFLPYVPPNFHAKPTRVAWMWPLVGRPHRSATNTFIDNKLAASLEEGGRLARLLDAAEKATKGSPQSSRSSAIPLTWTVDPALLQAASDMADGYRISGLGSAMATEHETSEAANAWLDRLRETIGRQTVLSLPYADPDVMAMHRAGLDKNIFLALTLGPRTTQEILGRQVTTNTVWPPGGWLNQDTLDTLAVRGTETVIVNENSLPPAQTLTYTPSSAGVAYTVGGTVSALVADSTLTDILGKATAKPGSGVLAEQRFLAETALITDELPNRARTLLIAPPRRWEPPPGFAASVLRDSSQMPWLRPVDLDYVRSHPAEIERGQLYYSPKARKQELPQSYLAKVNKMYQDLKRFAGIVEQRPTLFDLALLRTESSAWRRRPTLGKQLREVVRKSLTAKMSKVRILAPEQVTLASETGTLPITVANNLTEHAVNVRLKVRPHNRARLHLGDYDSRLRIGPGQKKTIHVRMTAVASGVAEATARLKAPDGANYGEPVRLKIHVTGYGTAALVITGSAIAVLFLAVAARLTRRTLKSAAVSDGDDGEDTEEQA